MKSTTVSTQFGKLLMRVSPSPRNIAAYKLHEQTVRRRLETVFRTNQVTRIGSYSRGSSIRSTSDIDLMLILERDEVRRGRGWKSSTTVLKHIRDELLFRYPFTNITRDVHVVVVQFAGSQQRVEVVPSFYWQHGGAKNYPVFAIPDGKGGWMATSPHAHNKFIKDANKQSGGKLKRVAQLLRFWGRCRFPNVPLSSFYVEMLLAEEGICVGPKSYALCMNNALATLANRRCAALEDPLEISGMVMASETKDKRRKVQAAVLGSARRAYRALMAEMRCDWGEALRLWGLVFNGNFPMR